MAIVCSATLKDAYKTSLFSSLAASFAIKAAATVVPEGTSVTLCTQMTTAGNIMILDREVMLTLSTVNGTGDYTLASPPGHFPK